MRDEPRNHPLYLSLVAFAALATNPFLFSGRAQHLLAGLPTWLWWSISWTVVLSLLTAFGLLRFWKEDDDDEQ